MTQTDRRRLCLALALAAPLVLAGAAGAADTETIKLTTRLA